MLAQRIILGQRLDFVNVQRRAGDLAASSAASRSASLMMPPRAQLRTRTPFFILAKAAALTMPLVSSRHRHVDGDEIGAGIKVVQSSTSSTCKRLGARQR